VFIVELPDDTAQLRLLFVHARSLDPVLRNGSGPIAGPCCVGRLVTWGC
jgi:hypothetical protein